MYCGFENLKLALKDCEAYSDFFFFAEMHCIM